jgi:branched-chain amino acid transport system ATP-binding protein
VLRVNNIEVSYQGVIRVLYGISLEVGDGQIVALIGANGGGKTTTLKSISGLLKTEQGQITSGNIIFDDKQLDRYGPEDIARMGVSQVMEGRRTLEHLSVEENLQIGAYRRRDRAGIKRDMEMVYDYFPKIREFRKRVSGYLSGGNSR